MATHKAVVISEVGKPVTIISRPTPDPKGNHILIRVTTAGTQPLSQKQRDYGLFVLDTGLPATFLTDLAGIVEKVGPEVTKFKPGDEVFGQVNFQGTYDERGSQDYALLDEHVTLHVPKGVSASAATTILSNFYTNIGFFGPRGLGFPAPSSSEFAAYDFGAQSVTIIGGGTDVGRHATQFARLLGLKTIIVIGSMASTDYLKSLGATHVLDRRASIEDIVSQAHAIAGAKGISRVFDAFNTDSTLAVALLTDHEHGKVVTVLPSSGVDVSKVKVKEGIYDIGMVRGSLHANWETVGVWLMENMNGWIERGLIKPTPFKDFEVGLDAVGLDRVLNDYRDGKNPGRWHLHPSA